MDLAYAAAEEEFAPRFAELVKLGAAGLMIAGDPFFNNRAAQLGALSLRHALPTIYQTRQFAAAGGLISYGSNVLEQYRLLGVYTGRVLKGEKPADLPVQQPTKVELIINLKTAKALRAEGSTGAPRVGIFRIYEAHASEVVLGEDDAHLDFRLSVRRGEGRLTAVTVVHCHNLLGRSYIRLIAPIHRRVVRSALDRAARSGWPMAAA